jgi:hypothetical protein
MSAGTLSHPSSAPARSEPQDRERAISPRVSAAEWSADHVVAPGDSHDKGEVSLCVGEAA